MTTPLTKNSGNIVPPAPRDSLWKLLGSLYKAHPWHGISPGENAPDELLCFVEVVPTDTMKYEMDKLTGYLHLDRPQKYSSLCPTLYGFVPQTLCGPRVASLSAGIGGTGLAGDGDPLDICILTERPISHGNILVDCLPIGGFRMLDHGEADDKIIAVLKGDAVYGEYRSIDEVTTATLDRLRHYFLTYKLPPGATTSATTISETYDRPEALEVVKSSLADYRESFGALDALLTEAMHLMSHGTGGAA